MTIGLQRGAFQKLSPVPLFLIDLIPLYHKHFSIPILQGWLQPQPMPVNQNLSLNSPLLRPRHQVIISSVFCRAYPSKQAINCNHLRQSRQMNCLSIKLLINFKRRNRRLTAFSSCERTAGSTPNLLLGREAGPGRATPS